MDGELTLRGVAANCCRDIPLLTFWPASRALPYAADT